MKFSNLIQHVEVAKRHGGDPGITRLCTDSRQAGPGVAFIAIRGTAADGHSFISNALSAGVSAIIAEDGSQVPESVALAVVPNTRTIAGSLAAAFHGHPSQKMTVTAITGTNGKTSTTYLAEAMLSHAGRAVGVIGTINYRYAGRLIPAPTTTPGPLELQQLLADMHRAGVTDVLMEASSHALEQHRLDGTELDCALFTNLTRDHLDYHATMADYANAKRRLFVPLLKNSRKASPSAVINADDPAGNDMIREFSGSIFRFSLTPESNAEIRSCELDVSLGGTRVVVDALGKRLILESSLIGRYNAANMLQALGIGLALGLDPEQAARGLGACPNIPGRLERVANDDNLSVFVDYSHTPDALENAISVLNPLKTGRLFVVFGCGGDRDRGKRPIMGRIASELADIPIVTSDNPRTEDPFAIIDEIRSGIDSTGRRAIDAETCAIDTNSYLVIENRREAIRHAVRLAQPGDVILISGKGHEDYQILGSTKHHFDDREEAAAAIADKRKEGDT